MELEIVSDSSVHNLILKRKRSQRQRPCGNSFSSSEDAVTTTTCAYPQELRLLGSSTEEDEDQEVAKCLILLAHGEHEYQTDHKYNSSPPIDKSWLDRKIDGGMYECKTCNRSFHSFQALGGHRTSHKKLKVDEPMLQKPAPRSPNNSFRNLVPLPPTPPLQLGNNRAAGKNRLHQCLICCAEFPSGQALGGHMRKHRVNLPQNSPLQTQTSTTETNKADDGLSITLSLSSPANEEAELETIRSNSEFQCLDLNLPASSSSEEDEISETRFSFTSKQSVQDSDTY